MITRCTFDVLNEKLHKWILLTSEHDPRYYEVIEVISFAKRIHVGMRKDKITPEFQHQVEIALYLTTIISQVIYPIETLAAAILHDTVEDYKTNISNFSLRTIQAVNLLDKTGKTSEQYYSDISCNPIASIVKGADRMHNLQSMVGVFSVEKQKKYIEETRAYVLPMLHSAIDRFPDQKDGYENIIHILNSQIHLIEYHLT